MDAHNALHNLKRSPYTTRDPGTGNNAGTYTVDRQFQTFEMIQSTASTAETRTLTGPDREGLRIKLSLISCASAGTIVVTHKDNAGNVVGTFTFSAAGNLLVLESNRSSYNTSSGAETIRWVPTFSNL